MITLNEAATLILFAITVLLALVFIAMSVLLSAVTVRSMWRCLRGRHDY